MKNKKKELTILKRGKIVYPKTPDDAELQKFDNPSPERDYTVEFETDEFTSLCPVTSQPDFGRIVITYTPDKECIESKSLKLYIFSYRNYGGFAEKIINRILDDVVDACSPKKAKITGYFKARGGITIKVETEYNKKE